MGACSAIAARLCTVSHGLPLPSCTTCSVAAPSGHASFTAPPLACVAQSATRRDAGDDAAPAAASDATVLPPTFADSNLAENLSSASEPHRFAVVVSQAP